MKLCAALILVGLVATTAYAIYSTLPR